MIHSRGSDLLLSTMLPTEIANALLLTGVAPPPKEHTCSILFTDIVGFTNMCSESSPSAIFDMLNDVRSLFWWQ